MFKSLSHKLSFQLTPASLATTNIRVILFIFKCCYKVAWFDWDAICAGSIPTVGQMFVWFESGCCGTMVVILYVHRMLNLNVGCLLLLFWRNQSKTSCLIVLMFENTNIIIMFIFHRHINQSSPNYKDAVSRKQQFPIRDESNTFDNIRVCSLAAIKCFFV